MKTSPSAGKPLESGMLINVPRLITAYYYTGVPDPSVPAQRVPYKKGRTYEDYVGLAGLERRGKINGVTK